MASAIRTIGHEDRLSLVDHLEELRTRLIISGIVLAVAFGVCLWQNHALLRNHQRAAARPRREAGRQRRRHRRPGGARPAGRAESRRQDTQAALRVLGKPGSGLSAKTRRNSRR